MVRGPRELGKPRQGEPGGVRSGGGGQVASAEEECVKNDGTSNDPATVRTLL